MRSRNPAIRLRRPFRACGGKPIHSTRVGGVLLGGSGRGGRFSGWRRAGCGLSHRIHAHVTGRDLMAKRWQAPPGRQGVCQHNERNLRPEAGVVDSYP